MSEHKNMKTEVNVFFSASWSEFFSGRGEKIDFLHSPLSCCFFPCRSPCCEFSRSTRERDFSAKRRSDDDMNFFLLFFQLFTFSKSPHFLLSHFSQHSTSEEEEKKFEWMKKRTRKENRVSSEKMNFFLPQFSLLFFACFFSHAAHNTIWAYQRFILPIRRALSLQRKLRLNKGNSKNFGR